MRKALALIGLPILLGGCGLPPALTAASWAVDGVSFLVSGKSVTDHAISEVAQQDCALFRIVQERDICVVHAEDGDDPQTAEASTADGTQRAAADPMIVAPEYAGLVAGFAPDTVRAAETGTASAVGFVADVGRFHDAAPKARPAQVASLRHDVQVNPLPAAVAPRAPEPAREPLPEAARESDYVSVTVVGSFQNAGNAERLAQKLRAMDSAVLTVRSAGKTWHRVVLDVPLARAQQAGFADAWILKTCRRGADANRCGEPPQAGVRVDEVQVAEAN